jgi:hypothetical protein
MRSIRYQSHILDAFAHTETSDGASTAALRSRIVEAAIQAIPNFREIAEEARGYIASNKETIELQNAWQAQLRLPEIT